MPEYKCQFCGKLCKNPQSRNIHEVSCKKKIEPTLPQEVKPTPSPSSPEEPTSKISKLDSQLRELPFYSEITDKMGKVDERILGLEQIILAINDNLKNITPQIQKIDSFISGNPVQPSASPQPTKEETIQRLEKVSAQTQPATASGDKLGAYLDKGIELLKIGAGSGNTGGGVEGKYKELLEVAQVFRAIQGDPIKQFTDGFKVFADIQKNAIAIAKGIPISPTIEEKPRPELEEHLRE